MRFKNFILLENVEPKDAAHLIKKHCSKFLEESGFDGTDSSAWLWRGVGGLPSYFYKYDVRKNREPTDTDKIIHAAIDEALYELFDIRFRSNAAFATGNKREADGYGKTCLFFPIGDYKFAWSGKIPDAYTYFQTNTTGDRLKDIFRSYLDRDVDYDEAYKMYKEIHKNDDEENNLWAKIVKKYITNGDAEYTDSNLKEAILSKNEIMFSCDSYYVLYVGKTQSSVNKDEWIDMSEQVLESLAKLI